MNYLCSFRPLFESAAGQEAVQKTGVPPFADDSCRREPDLESKFPSITAICRCGHFAPRLGEGDTVVYITRKARYFNATEAHWRLVAILKVLKSFPSHALAARWYESKRLPLPSNCIVPSNRPLPLVKTARHMCEVGCWDETYQKRAKRWGIFHVCEHLYCELFHPPAITATTMRNIFGRIPGTRTPPSISNAEFEALRKIAGINSTGTGGKRAVVQRAAAG